MIIQYMVTLTTICYLITWVEMRAGPGPEGFGRSSRPAPESMLQSPRVQPAGARRSGPEPSGSAGGAQRLGLGRVWLGWVSHRTGSTTTLQKLELKMATENIH